MLTLLTPDDNSGLSSSIFELVIVVVAIILVLVTAVEMVEVGTDELLVAFLTTELEFAIVTAAIASDMVGV